MHSSSRHRWIVFSAVVVVMLAGQPEAVWSQTPGAAVVRGAVVDGEGAGMSYVNVQITGTTDGDATGRDGRFEFSTRRLGNQKLRATMIGYEPAWRTLNLSAGDTVTVRLVLKEILVTLDEAFVTASAYSTGELEGVTLSTLDVLLTPGASADIFLAIKTFPGVAMVDEGAGLFVRGGDVTETVTLIDQASVIHPYKFESPTTSVFGTIPPFLVRGTAFSAGGFSARYGNALSGVLDMQSLDLPLQRRFYANVGLAAASLGVDLPVISNKLGLRFSGNRSFTDVLFQVNGQTNEFSLTPRSLDLNLSLVYKYSTTGRIKFFNYQTADQLGIRVNEPSFSGFYRGETTNGLHNIQWTEVLGKWFIQTSASLSRFVAHTQFGSLDLRPTDKDYKLRADVERRLSEGARLSLGGEVQRNADLAIGTVPTSDSSIAPDAETIELDERFPVTQAGGYVEFDLTPTRRIAARVGVRTDYHSLSDQVVVDPRVSLRYVFSKATDVRLAWGIYHQYATPILYNTQTGNPNLGPQRAQHFIAGINYQQDMLLFRLEAYYKPYRHLVIQDPDLNVANRGKGMARGLDVFLKYGQFLRTRVHGHMAYSYLQSRRLQPRDLGEEIVYERGPTPFDITHNLTIVAQTRLFGFLSVGVTLRHATGRPVTPILSAASSSDSTYFIPMEGPVGSERLPLFQRVDAQLSYYLPFGKDKAHNAVFYFSVGNLLNRTNVLGYEYSQDYSERNERTSDYNRFLYFGATVNLFR